MSTSAVGIVSAVTSGAEGLWMVWCVRTELVNAEDQDGLVDLEAQELGLHERERLSVDFDKSFAGLKYLYSVYCFSCVRSWHRMLYLAVGDGCSIMLALWLSLFRGRAEGVPVAVFFLPKHCTL